MPDTATTLALIRTYYPPFKEVDDHSFLCIIRNMTADPESSKKLLLQEKFSETDYDCRVALDAFRLPEGWGHFLRSFTDQVIDGISEGMPLTAIADITGDPHLTLLLQIIRIYAFFIEEDNPHLGALMANAQELLNLLRLVTKLRNGGTRLHQRIIDCVNRMLDVEW